MRAGFGLGLVAVCMVGCATTPPPPKGLAGCRAIAAAAGFDLSDEPATHIQDGMNAEHFTWELNAGLPGALCSLDRSSQVIRALEIGDHSLVAAPAQ